MINQIEERLVKIERKMLDVLKESLPFTVDEIKKNCKITSTYKI